MRLTGRLGAGYDASTNTLRIIGMEGTEKEAAIEIEIEDPDLFLGWLSSILFDFADDSRAGVGLLAHSIQVALTKNDDDEYVVVFLFEAGEMRMQFGVPISAVDPARLQSIQLHLDQALQEMGMTGAIQPQ